MKNLILALFLAVFIFNGCSTVTVKSDYDPEYNFGEFSSYRWATEKEFNPQDVLAQNPLVRKRVIDAVDKALAGKRIKKVEEGETADLVVVVHAGSKERMNVTSTGVTGGGYYGGWYDPWWGAYGGTTHVSYYEEATLVVDLVCWETKELAWRGMATGTVQENQTGEEQQERLDGIAVKIFENYPPGLKK